MPVLATRLDPRDATFVRNSEAMAALVADLRAKVSVIEQGGGEVSRQRHTGRGKLLPRERWNMTSHILIFHGRRICFARKPACEKCGVSDVCPSAFKAELVGRKPPRVVKLAPRVRA